MNITKLTENYILEHPSIKDYLKNGLINYSPLSRLIASELNLDLRKNFDAILITTENFLDLIKKHFRNKIILENDFLLRLNFCTRTLQVLHSGILSANSCAKS